VFSQHPKFPRAPRKSGPTPPVTPGQSVGVSDLEAAAPAG